MVRMVTDEREPSPLPLASLQLIRKLHRGDDRVSASQREELAVPGYQDAAAAGDEHRQDRRVVGIIRYLSGKPADVDDLGLEA